MIFFVKKKEEIIIKKNITLNFFINGINFFELNIRIKIITGKIVNELILRIIAVAAKIKILWYNGKCF